MAGKPDETMKETMKNKNVMKGPLWQFSRDPLTGFYRDGYCRTGPEDKGNHTIAATVSDEFLDFSAKNGNNLREVGVKDGMKWCLCTHRWKEAFDAAQKGSLAQSAVPKVHIHATEESALNSVSLKDLQRYKAEGEAPNQRNRQDSHIEPKVADSSSTSSNHPSGVPKAERGQHN